MSTTTTNSTHYRAAADYHPQPAASYPHGHAHGHGHSHGHGHLDALATAWPADPNVDHDSYAGPSPVQYLGDGSAPLHPPTTAPPAWPPTHHLRPALHAWQASMPNQPPCPARSTASYPPAAVHLYQPPSPPPPPPPHDLPALPVVQPSDQVGSQSTASWCIPPQYFVDHASHAYANVVATPTTAWPVQTTHTTMAPPIYQRSQDIVQPPPIYQHPQDDAQVAALYHHQRPQDDAQVPPIYPRPQDDAQPSALYHHQQPHDHVQEWAAYPGQPEYRPYDGHHIPLDPFSTASIQERPPPPPPSPKKKTAKVPSSFVERQEKMKVSKRRGPLQEKQREKTHTMRKTKRICVRCRFYKSGVCLLLHVKGVRLR